MDVTEFDVGELVGGADGLSGIALRGTRSHTPGQLHLTEVRDWLDARFDYSGRQKKNAGRGGGGGGGWTEDQFHYAGAAGFLFEDVIAGALSSALADCAQVPGLVRGFELGPLDGVVGSPDGYSARGGGELWEFKVTWRSLLTSPPESYWPWLMQVKSYCHMAGLQRAHIVALYVCGDWRPPRLLPPVGRTLEFTEQELAENWAMVRSAAHQMRREGGQGA